MDAGVLAARDKDEAAGMLRREGKSVVSIRPHQEQASDTTGTTGRRKKIKRDQVIFFSTQLAVMVDTGVPLDEALDAIAQQSDKPELTEVVGDLSEQVKAGQTLSSAMESHPKVFGKLFVALVRASEASGTMGQMLQRASQYMQSERKTRKQIKGAMTYPICMLSFCTIVIIALLTLVLPRFEKIYSGKGAVLPAPTQILLYISHAMTDYWYLLIPAVAAIIVGVYMYFRSQKGSILLDKIKINMPIIGPMYRKASLARSMRTLATMVSTDVGILEGLQITAEVSGNYYYSQMWTDLSEQVKTGSTLSERLFEYELVPRTLTQMIDAGERTGRLSGVLEKAADFCEEELSVSVKAITSLIEPAMIIIMGLIVGGIAIALLLPVFKLSNVVAQ